MINVTLPLAFEPVFVQCTWANAFTEPDWDRGLCIQSYDRLMMYDMWVRNGFVNPAVVEKTLGIKNLKLKRNQVGILTGETKTVHDREWLEVFLVYSNRRRYGWMRKSDIWYPSKGTKINTSDDPGLNNNDDPGLNNNDDEGGEDWNPGQKDNIEKKSPWAWIVGAISLLSVLK